VRTLLPVLLLGAVTAEVGAEPRVLADDELDAITAAGVSHQLWFVGAGSWAIEVRGPAAGELAGRHAVELVGPVGDQRTETFAQTTARTHSSGTGGVSTIKTIKAVSISDN
jgi:hypothetical protein